MMFQGCKSVNFCDFIKLLRLSYKELLALFIYTPFLNLCRLFDLLFVMPFLILNRSDSLCYYPFCINIYCLPSDKFTCHNCPFIPNLIMHFEENLFLFVSPFRSGNTHLKMIMISKIYNTLYLSLHCLPVLSGILN